MAHVSLSCENIPNVANVKWHILQKINPLLFLLYLFAYLFYLYVGKAHMYHGVGVGGLRGVKDNLQESVLLHLRFRLKSSGLVAS